MEHIDEMEAKGKSWKYTSIIKSFGDPVEERVVPTGDGSPIRVTRNIGVERTTVNALVRGGQDKSKVYGEYLDRIFSDTNAQTSIRTRIVEEFGNLADGECLAATYTPTPGKDKGKEVTHYYISNTIRRVIWLSDIAEKRNGKAVKTERIGTFWEGFPLNNLTKEGGVQFPHGKKPEALLRLILRLATNPGDLVLDSFAGSGTTGAVAHKMGRRWIMVELGDHADTHIVPRLNKVIDGQDPGGVTEATGWQGGGGYRYFRLAPSLLEKDQWGQYVISKEHKPEMLTEAVCKLMGFTYAPSQDHFWRHGHSTENDFIYVTTQRLPHDTLKKLSHEVGEGRSLLVCCRAHDENTFDNLTVRKIPHAVMAKCEWGRDDYSLNIQEAPTAPITEDDMQDDDTVEAAE